MLIEEQGLPLANHTQNTVVQQQNHKRNPVDHSGGQLVQIHAEASVTGNQNRALLGAQCSAHGGAHAEAHGTQTAAGDEPASIFQVQILGSPHLVLAHIGGDGGVFIQVLVEQTNDIPGGHAFPVVHTLLLFFQEPVNGFLPLGMLDFLQQGKQLLQGLFHVAPQTMGGGNGFAQFGAVNVNVDNLGAYGELGPVAGNPVIEPAAQGDNAVSVVHSSGAGVMAVHALHAQESGVIGGNTGNTHHGAADRSVNPLRNLQQFILRIAGNQTAAKVQEGALGGIDAVGSLLDADILGREAFHGGNRLLGFVFPLGDLHILGHINQNRAGTAGLGQPEGFPDGICQLINGADKEIVLGDGQGHAGNIDFLETIGADDGSGHVAGNGNQRDGIDVSGGNAGDQVGGTGAGGGDTDADLTGGSCVAVSGVGSALFMGSKDVFQFPLIFVQGIVDIDDLTTGVAKDHVGALFNQCAYDDIGTGKFHAIILSSGFL